LNYGADRFADTAEDFLDSVEDGHFGDIVKEGVSWDDHAIAPIGRDAELQTKVHVLVISYFYLFISLFKDTHILFTTSYLPVLFTLFSLLFVFLITKKLSNNVGAFFATTLLSVHFMFLSRTAWGYADTDFYNVFFPLVISWIFFEAVTLKNKIYKLSAVALCALIISVYSRTWLGWWFVLGLLVGAAGMAIIYKYFTAQISDAKSLSKLLFVFILFNILFLSMFSTTSISFLIEAPFSFNSIKDVALSDLWPNVYTTVAELNGQSLSSVFDKIGWNFMLLSIAGALFLLINRKPHTIFGSFYLVLWFCATFYASTKGSRFLLLLSFLRHSDQAIQKSLLFLL